MLTSSAVSFQCRPAERETIDIAGKRSLKLVKRPSENKQRRYSFVKSENFYRRLYGNGQVLPVFIQRSAKFPEF